MKRPGSHVIRAAEFLAFVILPVAAAACAAGRHAAPTLDQMKNATYRGIDADAVTLRDGLYQGEPLAPGAASRPRVMLLEDGVAFGDLDGDGLPEGAALLSENSGGSGQFLFLAAVASRGSKAESLATVRIGDRVQVRSFRIADGKAVLDLIIQTPDDPLCCPTLKARKTWALRGRTLQEVASEDLGHVSPADLGGVTWHLVEFDRGEPVPGGIDITATFDGGQVTGSAGCNRYFGAVAGGERAQSLKIGPLGSTQMACSGPVMDAEMRTLAALGKATSFSFRPGKVILSYDVPGGPKELILRAGN